MRRAILLWMIPLALCAQETRCTVEGMVANAATAEPLRRATVTIRRTDVARNYSGPTVYSAATDAQGKYVISDVEPGTYVFLAERSGFAPQKNNPSIKLERGQKSTGVLIMMTPHAVIAGHVLDDQGDPVTGADVQVSALSYDGGRKHMTRTGGGTTNDLGEYRVFGLPAGKYYVSVTYRPSQAQPNGEEYATTYYPRSVDAGAAVPIPVPAGAQLQNIDVTLARTRTVTVRGRVACDIQGEKRQFSLMLMPRLAMGAATVGMISRVGAVRSDGTFELSRMQPGAYNLMASATIDEKRYSARALVQVGDTDVDGVAIAIRPSGVVTGRMQVEGRPNERVSGVAVLRPWESGGVIFGPQPTTKLQADGTFQIDDVNVDRYSFHVTGLPEGYYLKSVRSGGADVLASGFEAAGGAAVFDVLISPNAGSVEGAVMDPRSQKLFVGATVVLVPEAKERTDLYRNVISDQEGHFRFKSLRPGEYRLFAWEDVSSFAWMDPDFMREIERKGQTVTVEEGRPQTVQVNLIGR
jgi:protocatechuate 3,4-dioxygenase beta subunit